MERQTLESRGRQLWSLRSGDSLGSCLKLEGAWFEWSHVDDDGLHEDSLGGGLD